MARIFPAVQMCRMGRSVNLQNRKMAVHIVLAAMLLRAIIPAGWMPNPSGTGQTPFIVCSLGGLQIVTPQSGDTDKQSSHDAPRNICPFAAAAHLAPGVAPLFFLPPLRGSFAVPLVEQAQNILRPALDQAAPRGPPGLI